MPDNAVTKQIFLVYSGFSESSQALPPRIIHRVDVSTAIQTWFLPKLPQITVWWARNNPMTFNARHDFIQNAVLALALGIALPLTITRTIRRCTTDGSITRYMRRHRHAAQRLHELLVQRWSL